LRSDVQKVELIPKQVLTLKNSIHMRDYSGAPERQIFRTYQGISWEAEDQVTELTRLLQGSGVLWRRSFLMLQHTDLGRETKLSQCDDNTTI
jgi:hypothetical protein